MARVEIVERLFEDIERTFKGESTEVFDLIETVAGNPHKGKMLGTVAGIVIKELRYNNFRFYFITDGFKLKCCDSKELADLLLTFVRMSGKKDQQRVIDEIKRVLILIGPTGFE